MNKPLLRKLAKRIKNLRDEKDYTQDDLAALADIPRSTLGNIEAVNNDVTVSKVNKIAEAFEMSLSDFLNFNLYYFDCTFF